MENYFGAKRQSFSKLPLEIRKGGGMLDHPPDRMDVRGVVEPTRLLLSNPQGEGSNHPTQQHPPRRGVNFLKKKIQGCECE